MDEARFFDHLATVEERILATKRDAFFQSIGFALLFGCLSFWATGAYSVALLGGSFPAFLVFQIFRVQRVIHGRELDRMIFSYQGDMRTFHREMTARRGASSMLARQSHYYGT